MSPLARNIVVGLAWLLTIGCIGFMLGGVLMLVAILAVKVFTQ